MCQGICLWGGGKVEMCRRGVASISTAATLRLPSLLTKALEECAAFVLPPNHSGQINQESTMWKTL